MSGAPERTREERKEMAGACELRALVMEETAVKYPPGSRGQKQYERSAGMWRRIRDLVLRASEARESGEGRREYAQRWRNDAFEAAAGIAERYGADTACLQDIRAMIHPVSGAPADVESERIEAGLTDARRALVLDRLYKAAERDATELADDYETIAAAYQEASLEAQGWRSAALQARADLLSAPVDLGLPADTRWVEWSSQANTIRMIDRLAEGGESSRVDSDEEGM